MVKLIINNKRTFNISDLATLLKHRADVIERLQERFRNVKTITIQSDTFTLKLL